MGAGLGMIAVGVVVGSWFWFNLREAQLRRAEEARFRLFRGWMTFSRYTSFEEYWPKARRVDRAILLFGEAICAVLVVGGVVRFAIALWASAS